MNSYLKEIADACGINKNLTYHLARYTFATTVTLSNGVPIETVSKMLDHRNIKTTQHYAKILDKKISDDMRSLRLKFSAAEQIFNQAQPVRLIHRICFSSKHEFLVLNIFIVLTVFQYLFEYHHRNETSINRYRQPTLQIRLSLNISLFQVPRRQQSNGSLLFHTFIVNIKSVTWFYSCVINLLKIFIKSFNFFVPHIISIDRINNSVRSSN